MTRWYPPRNLCAVIVLAPLLLAVQSDLPVRDLSWGSVLGWEIVRAEAGGCVARRPGANVSAHLEDGLPVVMIAVDPAVGVDTSSLTFRWREFSGRYKSRTATVPVVWREGPLGQGLYLDVAVFRPLMNVSGSEIHRGRNAKQESIGLLESFGLGSALEALPLCARAVAVERHPPAPLHGEGVPQSLLPLPAYIGTDDYPPAAIRAEITGDVIYQLEIAEDGYPDRCAIARSSGSAVLDQTTCTLIRKRVRFVPRVDDGGKPIRQSARGLLRWSLPRD